MTKPKLRLTLFSYGFCNSAKMLTVADGTFTLHIPERFYSTYWKLNEGEIVIVGASLN